MNQASGIKVSPNPAQAGGSVTIVGAPNSKVLVGYKGNVRRLKLDKRGKLVLPVPAEAGETFTVSNGKLPLSNVVVKVVSSGSRANTSLFEEIDS